MSTALGKYDPYAPGGSSRIRDMLIMLRIRAEWAIALAFATPADSHGKFSVMFEEHTRNAKLADALLVDAVNKAAGYK